MSSFNQYIQLLMVLEGLTEEEATLRAEEEYFEQWGKTPYEHQAEIDRAWLWADEGTTN